MTTMTRADRTRKMRREFYANEYAQPAIFARPVYPNGRPDEAPALSMPIDQRALPTIDGVGLTSAESIRVNGARNRARTAYGAGCPEASEAEIETVARLAATDELRRTLRDRPAAPPLKAVAQVEEVSRVASPAKPAPGRRMPFTANDTAWWAENSPTRFSGYDVLIPAPAPIRGGSTEVDGFPARRRQAERGPMPRRRSTGLTGWTDADQSLHHGYC